LCQCDCGRQEVIKQIRLPHVASNAARKDAAYECSHCASQRTCKVCGKVFESRLYRATCSDECRLAQARANDLEHYYRRMQANPDHNKQIRARLKERAAVDPEFAERLRKRWSEQDRRKHERIMADEQRKNSVRAKARERYYRDHQANRERINVRLRDRILAMTGAEYEQWLERQRAIYRRYARRNRSTPEGREKYREYMRMFRAQQALRKLAGLGQQLIDRSDKNE
jgi:hypothetical protein